MKACALTIICFLLTLNTSVSAQKKYRKEVRKPYFTVRSGNQLEIEKVVLTTDTTFLDIKIYGRPSEEVNIDSTATLTYNGKKYILCGKENLAPQGQWVKLSADGERSARIKFEPLPVEADSFDFAEEAEGGWQIKGIRLDGKRPGGDIPLELKQQSFGEESFPTIGLQSGKSVIRGRILGYTPELEIELGASNRSWLVDNFMPADIPVNADGTFVIENYSVASISTNLSLNGGGSITGIFSMPGSEVEIAIDLPSFYMSKSRVLEKEYKDIPSVWFSGDYARLNTELYANAHLRSVFNSIFFSDICGMTPIEYKKYVLKKFKKSKNEIEKNKQISEVTRRMLSLDLEMSAFNAIAGYKSNLSYAPMISGKKGVKRADMTIDDDYYDEILTFDFIGKPEAVINNSYTGFVRYAIELFPDKISPQQPLWDDIMLAGKFNRQFGGANPLNDKMRATADSIQTPEMRKGIEFIDNIAKAKLAELEKKTGYTVLALDSAVVNEQLMAAMVAPYKGKVVFVDFWATWCGPCIRAMKSVLPLKEKYASKDVVFLYVTGETSPEGTWKMAIPDIKGDHYRLTGEQWNYLMTSYEIPGIPAYFIVDRKGDIVYKNIGFPGVNKVEEEIEKALGN